MPNWCTVKYSISGEDTRIIVKALENSLSESSGITDFAYTLGIDVNIRGYIEDYSIGEGYVLINMQEAWGEDVDFRDTLLKKFNIDILYYVEEPGSGIYCTNDINGCQFPDRYIFFNGFDYEFFCSLEELISNLNEYHNANIKDTNIDAVREFLDKKYDIDGSYLIEIEVEC